MGSKNLISFLFSITALLLAACSSPSQQVDGKLYVVTTTGMIADAVKNIGADLIEVEALMGPGVDPHLYKATQGDLKRLTNSNIIFYNGLHLEGKMGEVLANLGRQKPVVAIGDELTEAQLRLADGFVGAHDPHIWFSAVLWQDAVRKIGETLQQLDPDNAVAYAQNTERYLAELNTLNTWIHAQVNTLPVDKRILVTAHDAFGYFGDTYAFQVRGLQGLSTLAEFGLKDRTNLVDFIVENKIKAVFVETSVPRRSIDAVISGCRDKGFDVVIGGNLYSDAMGAEGTPEGTYIGMFKANVNTIINALK